MKRLILVLTFVVVFTPYANADSLFGVDRIEDELVYLDIMTGEGTVIGSTAIPNIPEDFGLGLESLAYDPLLNVFYAIDNNQVDGGMHLLRYDPETWDGQVIGLLGTSLRVLGLAFDPVNRILYSVEATGNPFNDVPTLISIDINTGNMTHIGDLDIPRNNPFFGLAYSVLRDVLYASDELSDLHGSSIYEINPLNANVSLIGAIGVPGQTITGLSYDNNCDVLYGSSDTYLFSIEVQTGSGTIVGSHNQTEITGLALVTPIPSTEHVLFGWQYSPHLTGPGLVSIDTQTADRTLIISSDRGIEALAFDSTTETLYGVEQKWGVEDNVLVVIDPDTGTISDVGPVGFTEITAMTFDETTNKIYALDQTTRTLLEINPSTGEAISIGNFSLPASNGLAAQPITGDLFASVYVDPGYLARIDKSTAASTLVGPFDEANSAHVRGLSFNPDTGVLYGQAGGVFPGPFADGRLVTIDLATGQATPIGESQGQITALAFVEWSAVETDTDGDGIPDSEDECVDSDLSPTIVIDGCDSGVLNTLFPEGCTIIDEIAELAGSSTSHGEFVSAIAHYTNDLKKDGVITGEEKETIQSCAGQAGIP